MFATKRLGFRTALCLRAYWLEKRETQRNFCLFFGWGMVFSSAEGVYSMDLAPSLPRTVFLPKEKLGFVACWSMLTVHHRFHSAALGNFVLGLVSITHPHGRNQEVEFNFSFCL